MNVFLAGATGVLGRRLIGRFIARDHQVIALVRTRDGERRAESLGATARFADLFDTAALVHAAEGADVVIHAATAIPTKSRTSPRDWALNDRIRREGTQALADCAAAIGAKQFIFQSVAWVARPPDDAPFDEDSPPHADPLLQSALDGERIAQDAGARNGFTVSILRGGWFYSADAAHTRMFAAGLRRRRMPIIGRGDAVCGLVHVDDAANAFVAAAEAGQGGLWHVVDDEPVAVADFLTAFAKLLTAPTPRYVPLWLARLLAGRIAVEFFTRSTRTNNDRIQRDLGWRPQFPTYREGLAEIAASLLPA